LKYIYVTFGYVRVAHWAAAQDVVHPESKGKGKGKAIQNIPHRRLMKGTNIYFAAL